MANQLDRLFREGLDQLEVTPEAKSWEQVQAQINGKKKPVWLSPLSIAASIVLLLSISIVLFTARNSQREGQSAVAVADRPAQVNIPPIEVPTPQQILVKEETKKSNRTIPVMKQEAEVLYDRKFEQIAVASINHAQLETELAQQDPVPSLQRREKQQTTVKITYIATVENEKEKENKIGQLISSLGSRDLSPGEVLADLRDAKDNLFNRN